MDNRTTTSRGCLRQAAPHAATPAFDWVLLLLIRLLRLWFSIPYAFSSEKISVKNPGSELMRNILPLRRFTISKHLKKITEIKYISIRQCVHKQNLTDPKTYPLSPPPKTVSTDS